MEIDNVWNKFETHLINEGITQSRINKLKGVYNFWNKNTSTNLDKLKRPEIEEIVTNLNKGLYKKDTGKPYGSATISDFKKFIKQFFKYLKGENNFFPTEVAWISTKIPKDKKADEKEIITIEDVKKLSKGFKRSLYSFTVLVLFDSGFRIEELMSVKVKDISFEEFDNKKNKCFFINCNQSKTFPRKIPIPLFTKELSKYFKNDDDYLEKNKEDLLFDIHYESFNKLLKKKGLSLFGKKITPHNLRHSSATYYTHAHKLTYHQLCDRYGWSYSSNVPAKYIRRSGNNNLDSAKQVFSNEIVKLKEENEELRVDVNKLNESMKQVLDYMGSLIEKDFKEEKGNFMKLKGSNVVMDKYTHKKAKEFFNS